MRVLMVLCLVGLMGACETHRAPSRPLPPGIYQGPGVSGGCFACRMDDDGLDCTCPKLDGTMADAHIAPETIAKCKGGALANVDGTFVCADQV